MKVHSGRAIATAGAAWPATSPHRPIRRARPPEMPKITRPASNMAAPTRWSITPPARLRPEIRSAGAGRVGRAVAAATIVNFARQRVDRRLEPGRHIFSPRHRTLPAAMADYDQTIVIAIKTAWHVRLLMSSNEQ